MNENGIMDSENVGVETKYKEIEYKEIEYKYMADKISLYNFQILMDTLVYNNNIFVKSKDDYFSSDDTKVNFVRYRYNDTYQELTLKKRTNIVNNNNRIEINLQTLTNCDTVNAFLELLGYHKDFTIIKDCYIYYFDDAEIVYYSVYDINDKLVGTFIEIEAHSHFNENDSFNIINSYEKKLESLGINYKNRLKKSLYEIYNKK